MTVSACTGAVSGIIFAEADRAGSGNQRHTSGIHGASEGDFLIAAKFTKSREFGVGQFLFQNFFHPGVGNSGSADAEPGAVFHTAAGGKNLCQKLTKGFLANGIQIKGPEFGPGNEMVILIAEFHPGVGASAVNSCNKHRIPHNATGEIPVVSSPLRTASNAWNAAPV